MEHDQIAQLVKQLARIEIRLENIEKLLMSPKIIVDMAARDLIVFSEREKDVLQGVIGGQSNKEIGAVLRISEASVKSAMQQLFIKTGVRTRAQLVVWVSRITTEGKLDR